MIEVLKSNYISYLFSTHFHVFDRLPHRPWREYDSLVFICLNNIYKQYYLPLTRQGRHLAGVTASERPAPSQADSPTDRRTSNINPAIYFSILVL